MERIGLSVFKKAEYIMTTIVEHFSTYETLVTHIFSIM